MRRTNTNHYRNLDRLHERMLRATMPKTSAQDDTRLRAYHDGNETIAEVVVKTLTYRLAEKK